MYRVGCRSELVYPDVQHIPHEKGRCWIFLPVVRGPRGNQISSNRRFLRPGSRLLVNNSEVEDCAQNRLTARGYQAVDGRWLAIYPGLISINTPAPYPFSESEVIEDSDESDAMGGVFSQIDLFGWTRNYEWPVFDRSVQAFLDARTGTGNHRQKDNGEYHQGIDSWADQYLNDIKASTTLWSKFTGIFIHDLVVIGSVCSVCLFLGLLISTIAMAITLCRRKGEELRRLGIMRALNFICCSSGSFLRELLDVRAQQAGFLDDDARELQEFLPQQPIIRGSQMMVRSPDLSTDHDTDSWSSTNPPRYRTVDRGETLFISRQPSTGRVQHVEHLRGPLDYTQLAQLPRTKASAPLRQAAAPLEPQLPSYQDELLSAQPAATVEGQLVTYRQPTASASPTPINTVSSSAPDPRKQIYQKIKKLSQ